MQPLGVGLGTYSAVAKLSDISSLVQKQLFLLCHELRIAAADC